MIDWLHCFGPVERQHIMGGTYRNKKGLPHSQKAKESKERTGVPRYPLIALPWGFKDLTLGSIYLLDVPQTLKVIAWGWSLSHRGFGGTFNIQSIVTWANSGLSYKMHVWKTKGQVLQRVKPNASGNGVIRLHSYWIYEYVIAICTPFSSHTLVP
jgi:hypothetical protein